MSQTIYFVGKPYPKRTSIQKVRELGYNIGIFLDKALPLKNPELYNRIIPLDFSNPETIAAQLADISGIDAAGLICTYENYVIAKATLGELLHVAAPSVASARLCTDKFLMREAFTRANPSITPRHALVASKAALLQFAETASYPLIIKPTNLVKSLLVLTCNDQAALLQNYQYARENIQQLYEKHRIYGRRPQIIVEEYVTGKSCSIAAFVEADGTPRYCPDIVSLTTAQDIGRADNYLYRRALPGMLDAKLESQLFATANTGIQALDMRSTPAHVELIYTPDGNVKIIEIGARVGGYRPRMYRAGYGLDLIEQEIELAVGHSPDFNGSLQKYCAVYELFPEQEGLFAGLRSANPAHYAYFSVPARPGDRVGPAKNGHKAAAVIMVTADTPQQFSEYCAQVDTVRVELQ